MNCFTELLGVNGKKKKKKKIVDMATYRILSKFPKNVNF